MQLGTKYYLQVLRGRIPVLQSVRLGKASGAHAARPLQLLAARLALLVRGRPLQLQRFPVCLQRPCIPNNWSKQSPCLYESAVKARTSEMDHVTWVSCCGLHVDDSFALHHKRVQLTHTLLRSCCMMSPSQPAMRS